MKSGIIITYGDENVTLNTTNICNSFLIIPFVHVYVTHKQVGADFTTKTLMSVDDMSPAGPDIS